MANPSNGVLSLGEFNQSDFEAPQRSTNQMSRTWKIAQETFTDMGISPNGVLSIEEFNQSGFEAPSRTTNQISATWKIEGKDEGEEGHDM